MAELDVQRVGDALELAAARDLAHLLGHAQADVRRGAAESALGLTGTARGRALLCRGGALAALAALVVAAREEDEDAEDEDGGAGGASGAGGAAAAARVRGSCVELALKALVNLSAGVEEDGAAAAAAAEAAAAAAAAPPEGPSAGGSALALAAAAAAAAAGDADESASAGAVRALLAQRPPLVAGLLARLRDGERGGRGAAVLLLVNLTRGGPAGAGAGAAAAADQSGAGAGADLDADAHADESEGVRQLLADGGVALRRLVQLVAAPEPPPPRAGARALGASAEGDAFELAAGVLANAARARRARDVLLDPERRLLPLLLPQLQARSAARRRGAAFALRNCCFGAGADAARVAHLLAPSVDLVTHLCLPLAGDAARYRPEELAGMPPALAALDGAKRRERDAPARRALVEALRVLAGGSRAAREHMRAARTYPVVRAFHEWLETEAQLPEAAEGAGEEGAQAGAAAATGAAEEADGDAPLPPDDEATVAAINVLMQQLWRDDEVAAAPPGPLRLEKQRPRRGGPASLSEREEILAVAPSVDLDTARGIARVAAHNLRVTDAEVGSWSTAASGRAVAELGLGFDD